MACSTASLPAAALARGPSATSTSTPATRSCASRRFTPFPTTARCSKSSRGIESAGRDRKHKPRRHEGHEEKTDRMSDGVAKEPVVTKGRHSDFVIVFVSFVSLWLIFFSPAHSKWRSEVTNRRRHRGGI